MPGCARSAQPWWTILHCTRTAIESWWRSWVDGASSWSEQFLLSQTSLLHPYLLWCLAALSLFLLILLVDQVINQVSVHRNPPMTVGDWWEAHLDEDEMQVAGPLLGVQASSRDSPPVVLREVRSTPMMWSIWANQFQDLPEKVKVEMWHYLQQHGADPTRMRGFTFDATNKGMWVEYVDVDSLNIPYMDMEGQDTGLVGGPRVRSEWIVLEDIKGKDRPHFLEWMTPSADPPEHLGQPGNPKYPRVQLKDSEWGSGRDGY